MLRADSHAMRRVFAGLIALGCAIIIAPLVFVSPQQKAQWTACRLLATHDYTPAKRMAEELVRDDPDNAINQLLLAEAYSGLQVTEEALAAYRAAKLDEVELQIVKDYGIGERLLSDGQMRSAEPHLRAALQRDPEHLEAAEKLAFLLRIQGRIWESMTPVQTLVRGDNFRGDEIHMLGSQLLVVSDEMYLERAAARLPDDPLPVLGKTRLHLTNNELDEAERLLNELQKKAGDIVEIQAMKGWLLNEAARDNEFLEWNAGLAADADAHPGIWFARGRYLARQRRDEEAARCFIEVIRRSPNHFEATYRLSQLLSTLGHSDSAAAAGQRAQELAKVELAIQELAGDHSFEFMEKAVSQLARVERYWEAAALSELAGRVLPERRDWSRNKLREYCSLIESDHSFDADWLPISGLKPEEFLLPDWSGSSQQKTQTHRANQITAEPGEIAFQEMAKEVGIEFTYFNGSTASQTLGHIFETTGGGVAALDLDSDGWPDLWLAQGNDVWAEKQETALLDRIYRNLDGLRFQDVTRLCGVYETGFSQGVAVGDVNSDGLPDVCVGNVGPNRLYLNNGDGTFSDVSEESGISGNEWTLSPAIVDLNQDGLPEIYCVNYLKTDEVLARRCSRNGVPLTCAPTLFGAEQDHVYLNTGSLVFQDVTATSGIVCPDGKGLSIIAADFDHSGRISLFIGNDTTNNFFFQNTSDRGGPLHFTEEAIVRGLACDGRGRAQATMGVAADDLNEDGSPDLFIANFYDDPNTLYLSDPSGIYTDATREHGLYDAGYSMLGFGTQCLDADLDGRPDLIIANGHVDSSKATGEPDLMRPQFFRNTGSGFVEMQSEQLGHFFEQKFFGRALTRLDWNRDGRPDFCVLNLYHPVSMVTNTTRNPGNVLVVRLIGTTVDRDAVGTSVRIDAGKQSWTRQLMAGDGYESNNERLLVFGLGEPTQIDQMTVTWASGSVQKFTQIAAGVLVTAIELSPHLVTTPIPAEQPRLGRRHRD